MPANNSLTHLKPATLFRLAREGQPLDGAQARRLFELYDEIANGAQGAIARRERARADLAELKTERYRLEFEREREVESYLEAPRFERVSVQWARLAKAARAAMRRMNAAGEAFGRPLRDRKGGGDV